MVGVGSGARSRYWRKIKESLCRDYGNLDVQLPLADPLKCGESASTFRSAPGQALCDATTDHSFETLVDVWDPGRISTTPMVHIDSARSISQFFVRSYSRDETC